MTNKLREYIDELFAQAPATKKTVEVKEEILQNITDKYDDLITQGKTEEAAYNLAIAAIGDVSELVAELKGSAQQENARANSEEVKKSRALMNAIAVALYVICVIPVMLNPSPQGAVVMFLMIGAATGLMVYSSMTKPRYVKTEATMVEDFREWRSSSDNRSSAMKSIKGALWSVAVALYLLISFTSHQWHITWVIFILALAVQKIIEAVFELKEKQP